MYKCIYNKYDTDRLVCRQFELESLNPIEKHKRVLIETLGIMLDHKNKEYRETDS